MKAAKYAVMRRVLVLLPAFLMLLDAPALGQQRRQRPELVANLEHDRKARASSRFLSFAASVKGDLREVAHRPAPRAYPLPSGALVVPGATQPGLLLDKGERLLKRKIRRKAARIGRSGAEPWQKIALIQRLIRMQVQHAGNVPSEDNPYYRFNTRALRLGAPVQLREYLKLRKVLCLELAYLTQVALEDAGFRAGFAQGVIFKNNDRIGAHAWNTVLLDGRRSIVDTTNPSFNGEDAVALGATGTPDGWRFVRDVSLPDVTLR